MDYYFKVSLGLTSNDKKQSFTPELAANMVGKRLGLKGFDGATFSVARGFWLGSFEDTLIVEIFGNRSDLPKIKDICEGLKIDFLQDCVLLSHKPAPETLLI